MRYRTVKGLRDDAFRRATGVKRATFEGMLTILRSADQQRRKKGGPKPRLTLSDRLLMALMYLREYRTYFHVGQTYGVSETACFRTCRWIEDTLMHSGAYRLPGRKVLLASDGVFETVVIDVTETPVERPKKTTAQLFRQEEASHAEVAGRRGPGHRPDPVRARHPARPLP